MSQNSLANRLLSRGRVAKLGKGIHENVVLSKVDIADRLKNGMPTSKTLFLTFAQLDEKSNKKKAEIEVSWWKLDSKKPDYLFDNMRELCIQLQGILESYMDEDAAYDAMSTLFNDWDFKTVEDIRDHTWKIADVDLFLKNIKTKFKAAVNAYVGIGGETKLRLKISTDKTGMYPEIPRYGKFTENAENEPTLKFTDAEIRIHSNSGTTVSKGTATNDLLEAGL